MKKLGRMGDYVTNNPYLRGRLGAWDRCGFSSGVLLSRRLWRVVLVRLFRVAVAVMGALGFIRVAVAVMGVLGFVRVAVAVMRVLVLGVGVAIAVMGVLAPIGIAIVVMGVPMPVIIAVATVVG